METNVLALSLSDLPNLPGILMAAAGLGFIIFVHELGHFAVARMCGVKCEKFMVGFDFWGMKLSRKWGETEYGIGVFPLGGYVKMLGQDDDPSKSAEQIEATKVAEDSEYAKEITGPDGQKRFVDRRSYQAKSVLQRMAIISAGVIMNVIFAFVFAFFAFGMGVEYIACKVGQASPGDPAWTAGFETGDEVLQIGDRKAPSFSHLSADVTLADLDAGVDFVIRRAATGETESINLKPVKRGGTAKIGISDPLTTSINSKVDQKKLTKMAKPFGLPEFAPGDRITAIDGVEIQDMRGLVDALAAAADGSPVEVTVARAAATEATGNQENASVETTPVKLSLAAVPAKGLGIVMTVGPISGVQAGSPAMTLGLTKGDSIIAVDGQPFEAGNTLPTGKAFSLSVLRNGQEEPTDFQVPALPAEPIERFRSTKAPGILNSIGIVYEVLPKVSRIEPDSPAAKAGVQVGDSVKSVTFWRKAKDSDELKAGVSRLLYEPEPRPWYWFGFFANPEPWTWSGVSWDIANAKDDVEVELAIDRDGELSTARIKPSTAQGKYISHRNLLGLLERELRMRKVTSAGEQASYALDQTKYSLTMVFRVLSKLISRQVPAKELGGPLMILSSSYSVASQSTPQFLLFLTLISANLAVLNFLPIPVLDGGHMVFLAYEGITGRPAPEKLMIVLQNIGVLMLLSLMLFVTWNDIMRFFG